MTTAIESRAPTSSAVLWITSFTAVMCALGALMVSLIVNGVISPNPWNTFFLLASAGGYLIIFLMTSRHRGETVAPTSTTRGAVVIGCAVAVAVIAATLSIAIASWIPMAVAALLVGGLAFYARTLSHKHA